MFGRLRTRTNPVFYPDQLRLVLNDDRERVQRAFEDPDSLDMLVWNVFASLDTHTDENWIAYRLQALGGSAVDPPVRMSLFSGRVNAPILRSSHEYLDYIRSRYPARDGSNGSLGEFADPIEVPVRVETPSTLLLVDAALQALPRGNAGRDRMIELIDAGLDHARRVSKKLAVGVVDVPGSTASRELSQRINQLRDPDTLAGELPWRDQVPAVVLRELPWSDLIALWAEERRYMDLGGQPVRAFLEHVRTIGLR